MGRGGEMEADFGMARWTRDFMLAGAVVGAGAPSLVLGFIFWGAAEGVVVLLMLAVLGLSGSLVGALVGPISCALGRRVRGQALWTVPYGFVVGSLGGALGTAVVLPVLELPGFAVALAAMASGLVFGLFWMPYYALKLRGRSGLPWIALFGVGAPVLGALVMVGFAVGSGALYGGA